MTDPISIAFGATLAAVTQTMERVQSASEYVIPYDNLSNPIGRSLEWSQYIREERVEDLIGLIGSRGVTPYRGITQGDRDNLVTLARSYPELRVALERGAGAIERSIGTDIPLTIPLIPTFDTPQVLPKLGMALFLDALPKRIPHAYQGLQIFHLGAQAGDSSPVALSRFRKPTPREDGHPAAKEIAELSRMDLAGARVMPLSSKRVSLRSRVVHVGQFHLLGFDDLPSANRGILQTFSPWAPAIDILVLGGYFTRRESEAWRYIDHIRPAIAVLRTEGPNALEEDENGSWIARLNPRSTGESYIQLDPRMGQISVVVGTKSAQMPDQKWARWESLLRTREDGVLLGSGEGNMTRSRLVMNGALPAARRYLHTLGSRPDLAGQTEAKVQILRGLIDQMITPLKIRDTVSDHIWMFSELLRASGVLKGE